jgi:16S rRNA processing protein RimM
LSPVKNSLQSQILAKHLEQDSAQTELAAMWLEIGKIVGVQGLKGEVRVYPNTDFPERFLQPGQRWLLRPDRAEPESIELLAGRYIPNKGLYIIQLKGIADRSQAEALRDCRLMVPESDRPTLEADEFHVLDLVGLKVFEQTTQAYVGVVVDVLSAGNDLLEVQLASAHASEVADEQEPNEMGSSVEKVDSIAKSADKPVQSLSKRQTKPKAAPTVLIPFVKAIVPVVDIAQQRIEITPPAGLIEI